jgi:hypothetical protein
LPSLFGSFVQTRVQPSFKPPHPLH